jgi:transcriptional regulator with XRE-family HTH domain
MAIAAHFERGDERAGGERRTLRLDTRSITGSGMAEVRVHNLSETGMLLEGSVALQVGETLAVELPEAGLVPADVAWASGQFFGCQFAEPISASVISAAALYDASRPARDEGQPLLPLRDGFGAQLQRLRRERGLTLAQVADELEVSKPTVWAWEHDRSRPVESRIEALAAALGVGREELVAGSAAPDPLTQTIEAARLSIAGAAGASPDKVRIMIEL